ncbi:hypothetical protein TUM18999_05950 [Pseudomonas tohonis]|uniref:Uncharacterized protein n=1 Tax=Pseudomonas tohonis TaxID=2725477 RepID=A0A6J4E0B4_9PSED|nr:hypothetical protein TUM18999_05950 [Pseudomonas tohonis]
MPAAISRGAGARVDAQVVQLQLFRVEAQPRIAQAVHVDLLVPGCMEDMMRGGQKALQIQGVGIFFIQIARWIV